MSDLTALEGSGIVVLRKVLDAIVKKGLITRTSGCTVFY